MIVALSRHGLLMMPKGIRQKRLPDCKVARKLIEALQVLEAQEPGEITIIWVQADLEKGFLGVGKKHHGRKDES